MVRVERRRREDRAWIGRDTGVLGCTGENLAEEGVGTVVQGGTG